MKEFWLSCFGIMINCSKQYCSNAQCKKVVLTCVFTYIKNKMTSNNATVL